MIDPAVTLPGERPWRTRLRYSHDDGRDRRVGWVQNPRRVRWGIALKIVWAWLFTIQSAGLIAATATLD